MLAYLSLFFYHVGHWINQNREQLWEIIRSAVQQQKTSLGRNTHGHFIGDRETAASFEALFGKKHLDVTEKFRAIARR